MKPPRRTHRARGSALLEAGLSLLILVPILTGVIQIGYAFRVYSRLDSALRDAARYASRRPLDGLCAERTRNEIRNIVLYGAPAPPASAAPQVAGLRPSHIQVDYEMDGQGRPSGILLRISGYEVDSLFSRFTLQGRPLAAAPYLGAGLACRPQAAPAARRAP
jgi:TadE-like protein